MKKTLAPIGTPARVTVTVVPRTTYRLEWEYDGVKLTDAYPPEDGQPNFKPDRRLTVRTFFNRRAAYRAAAMRLVFVKRDRLATGRDGFKTTGCRACATAPHYPEDPPQCRYHGGDGFEQLVNRLASWLAWRDSVG